MFASRFPVLPLSSRVLDAAAEVGTEDAAQAAVEAPGEAAPAAGAIVPAGSVSPDDAQPRRPVRAKKRVVTCERCHKTFPRPGRFGPAPKHCPACQRMIRRERDQARAEAAEREAAAAIVERNALEGYDNLTWRNGSATAEEKRAV